jgi:peptidase E
MHLFLASAFDKTISKFLEVSKIDPSKSKVAFVADASDVYESEDKWWVENDRKAFVDAGFEVGEVKLEDLAKNNKLLDNFDIVHLCGGSRVKEHFLSPEFT